MIDKPELIEAYERWHQNVWPEIIESIKGAGILAMSIYRVSNRLFMSMEVEDDFSFEVKAKSDLHNSKVQEWEELMWHFQKPLPFAKAGEKWVLMKEIFILK